MTLWVKKLGKKLSTNKLLADRRGGTFVEYAILAAVIGVGTLGAWQAFGGSLTKKMSDTGKALEGANGAETAK